MDQLLRYDHYKVLGVPRDAPPQHIKRAYRERVKQCHPDRTGSSNAAQVFHAVHAAYTILIDAEQRARYDEQLRFYREASEPNTIKRSSTSCRQQRTVENEPDRPIHRFAFVGLHLTGLLFGVTLIAGILVGIILMDWPGYMILFCAPGVAVIPDSLAGLRLK